MADRKIKLQYQENEIAISIDVNDPLIKILNKILKEIKEKKILNYEKFLKELVCQLAKLNEWNCQNLSLFKEEEDTIKQFVGQIVDVLGLKSLVIKKGSGNNLTKKKGTSTKMSTSKNNNGDNKKHGQQKASPQEKQKWEELYYKAQKLAEEMVLLTGGPGGMVKQRNLYLRAEDKFLVNECKENFILKQKRLEEAYKEYYELQKKVKELPPDAGKRIEKLEDDEFYNELIDATL